MKLLPKFNTVVYNIKVSFLVLSATPIHPAINIAFFFLKINSFTLFFTIYTAGIYYLNLDLVFAIYRLYFIFLFFSLITYGATLDKGLNRLLLLFLMLNIVAWPLHFMSIDVFSSIRALNTLSGYHGTFREPSFFGEFIILILTIARNKRTICLLLLFSGMYTLHVKSGTMVAFGFMACLLYLINMLWLSKASKATIVLSMFFAFNYFIYEISLIEMSWRHPSNMFALSHYVELTPTYEYGQFLVNGAKFFGTIGFRNYFPGVFSIVPFFIASFGLVGAVFCVVFIVSVVRRFLRTEHTLPRHRRALVLAGFFWGLFFAPKWFPFAAVVCLYISNKNKAKI